MSEFLFTSESVSEGHPDKVADQISDAVLDAILSQDTSARVAAETLVKDNLVVLAGEITNKREAHVDAVAPRAGESMIDSAWDFAPSSPRYDIRFYRSNYLLVGRYTDDANVGPYLPLFAAAGEPAQLDLTEAKFQLRFKGRVWTTDDRRWGVWLAHTQQNQWQVYNDNISRPFRETNYMPEAIVSYRPGVDLGGGFKWNLLNASFNHQSNGRTDALSRSWNRLIAEAGVERENLAL